MSREKFIKLTGWAMMLGPVLLLVGGVANNRPEYHRLNASSLPIDRYANLADTPLIVLGMVFMSLGIVGMLLRYTPKWNGASFLLGLSALGGIASAVGVVMTAVDPESDGWMVMILGLAVQYLALAIFGFLTLRRQMMPRWNGLPLLALWFPVTLVLSSGLIPWEITNQILAGLWVISIVMFAGLGYLLQSDPQPGGIATAAA